MATPRDFNGSNRDLLPPPGTEEFVSPMRCFFGKDQVITCWKLSEEEKAAVAEHGVIWLSIMGHSHPPVAMSAFPLIAQIDAEGNRLPYDIDAPPPDPQEAVATLQDEERKRGLD